MFGMPAFAWGRPPAQCPDPTLLIERTVTLMCTGAGGFPTRSAASLAGLSEALPRPAFAQRGWPAWADGGYWAPDLEHVGDRFLLYYSARRRRDRRHCIGVAISNRPDGGFRDIGQPLIHDQRDGAIDPALLSVGDQLFLFYKRDGNSVGAPSVIFGRQLSADGLHVAGPNVRLLRGSARKVIEAPAPIHIGEETYLLYSQGAFAAPTYAEGEAVRTGEPLGPYTWVSPAPVLRGGGRWVGTGGGSIVLDGSRILLAYAAFRAGARPVRRLLFVRELNLVDGALRPVGQAWRIPLRA
jgi:hypothetical protein